MFFFGGGDWRRFGRLVGWGIKMDCYYTTHTLVFLRTLLYKQHTNGTGIVGRACCMSVSVVGPRGGGVLGTVDCVYDGEGGGMAWREVLPRCPGRLRDGKRPNSTFKITVCSHKYLMEMARLLRMSKHSTTTTSIFPHSKRTRATSNNQYLHPYFHVNLQNNRHV